MIAHRHADVNATDADRPPLRRRWELTSAAVGMGLSVVFLGGFARVVTGVDLASFTATLYPSLLAVMGRSPADLPPEPAFDAALVLASWFGFALIGVLLTSVVGIYVTRSRPDRATAGWFFLAAGLICLFGSQLILFPVAFFFFLTAGMFALRSRNPEQRSTS